MQRCETEAELITVADARVQQQRRGQSTNCRLSLAGAHCLAVVLVVVAEEGEGRVGLY